jgi:hypothetical protein
MIVLTAAIAAIVVMALHIWIEHLLAVKEKRDSCYHHHTKETKYMTYTNVHCTDCGKQWPKHD